MFVHIVGGSEAWTHFECGVQLKERARDGEGGTGERERAVYSLVNAARTTLETWPWSFRCHADPFSLAEGPVLPAPEL